MTAQGFEEQLIPNVGVAGASFGTYTTAKTVIPATSLITLPANYFNIGKTLRIKAWGGLGSLVTTPGLVTFQVMVGSVVAFTTGAIQLNATAHTNLPFELEIMLVCRAIGSSTSANLMGMARINSKVVTVTAAQTDGANSNSVIMVPATAAAVGTGFDSTVANILDFWAGESISDAANTVKIEMYTVESLN